MTASRALGRGSGAVARTAARAYRRGVIVRRLILLFALLGLFVAPAGMLGGAPAMAMSDHSMAGMSQDQASVGAVPHCAEMRDLAGGESPADKQLPDNCCVMTCVAIPPIGEELAVLSILPPARQPLPRMRDPHGLAPEADPPPPRFS